MRTVIWLKDDLRIHDSPAVAAALTASAATDVLILRSGTGPSTMVKPTARRLAAERRAITEIRTVAEASGISVVETGGGVHQILVTIRAHGAASVHANAQTSEGPEHVRDRLLAKALQANGIAYHEHLADGIGRGSRPVPPPFITSARQVPQVRFATVPTTIASLRRYLERLPRANYRRDMWTPGPDAHASSRLSIDLSCGTLSADRALHEIDQAKAGSHPRHHYAFNQFERRIHWRRGFIGMLEKSIGAFPWGPMRQVRQEDADRMAAWVGGETGYPLVDAAMWVGGETGYPLVDAAMRDLAADGWVNFRLRQLLNSFAIDLLDLDLHEAGVALGSMFDDYSPGIHWCQMALQSGMVAGHGPRVLNPVKQAKELDPDGVHVRKVLPYMRDVPQEHVHEPWLWSGYEGPRPIVDHMAAARDAKARHPITRAAKPK